MLYVLEKRKRRGKILYLKISFFIFSFILFPNSVFANTCKEGAFSGYVPNTGIAKIKEAEFAHFHRKPSRYTLHKMNLKNRWLGFRESRPDMHNEEAYTAWLIGKQKEGQVPDNPYGYRVQERLKQVAPFTYHIHYEVVPRIAPAWIPNDQLLKQNSQTVQQYKDWAEAYYLKSKFYPPGYLQYVKNSLDSHFFSGIFKGFKEDRRLRDVVYSLGGRSPVGNGDKKGTSTLINLIRGLTGQDRWLDGGTGSGFVLQDALEGISKERNVKDIPRALGITYNKPKPEDFDSVVVPEGFVFSATSYPVRLPEKLLRKYKVWDERLFQNIPIQELMPQFKLITDFFGIYTYNNNPVAVINKYLSIISSEGTIGIVYNNKDFVKTEKGIMFLHEWLASIAGRDLSIEHGMGWLNSPGAEKESGEIAYMLIRKTSEGQVELPNLTMVGYENAQRIFRPSADISGDF